VTLTGATNGSTSTDAAGNYSFGGLANGNYTVTPTHTGFVFTPASLTIAVTVVSVTGQNFTWQSAGMSITTDANVSNDGASASTTIATPAFSTTSGNELLLAFVATDYISGSNTKVHSITGGGLTWTLVKRTNVQSGTAEIWRAFATNPLSSVTVRATLPQEVAASITLVTYTGVDGTGSGAGAVGATGSGATNPGAPTASLVTTRNNSWVFGVGNDFCNAIGELRVRVRLSSTNFLRQTVTPTGCRFRIHAQR